MKRNLFIIGFLGLLIFISLSINVFGWSDWKTIKTEHFTILYKSEYENQAWEVLKTMEHYRPQVEKLTGNKAKHLPMVIEDVGTLTNGMANPIFYNIHLFTYPPSGSLAFTQNWWSLVGVHEYTHLLHLTKASGIPNLLSSLFGNIYAPNLWSPGWAVEGITVYSESQISPYQGRLNDGYFDAYMGARVAANRFPSLLTATYGPLEFPSGSIYLYGGKFFNYLARTYGEDKFAQFFENYGSSTLSLYSSLLPFIGIDQSAKKVYGKAFPQLWREWGKYESDRFKDFRLEGERITDHGWYVENPAIYGNKIYYQRQYPVKTGPFNQFDFSKIVAKDLTSGEERTVVSTTSFFTTPMRFQEDKLYYGIGEIKPGYANATLNTFGYYSLIYQKDLSTGEEEVLFEDELRAFEVTGDGNILYSKDLRDSFGSQLYLYHPDIQGKELLFKTDYLINEIVADGDKVIVSARKDWENFSLYRLDLNTGDFTALVKTPYVESNLSMGVDKLFYTANYEGKYSLYCYDFAESRIYRLTEDGFAGSPTYDKAHGTIYFIGLNTDGQDVYAKSAEFMEFDLPDFEPSAPPQLELAKSEVKEGGYGDNLATLTPKIRFPIASYDENPSAGLLLVGGDAVGDFLYTGILGYDFEDKQPKFFLNLINNFFAPLSSNISFGNTEGTFLANEWSFNLDVSYPLNRSLVTGMSELRLGTTLDLSENFTRKVLTPYIYLGYQFLATRGWINISTPLERKSVGSSMDRTGLYAELRLRHFLPPEKEVFINLKDIYDPDSPNPVFPKIRGYREALDTRFGATLSFDYSSPLLRIRDGLWNPSIYFEDLCGNFFIDGAFSFQGQWQLSTGIEFHIETRILNAMSSLPIDLGIRLVFNKDGGFGIEPTLYI